MLLLYAIPLGLLAGLAGFSGRSDLVARVGALGRVHVRFWPLAVAGLLFQLALFSAPVAGLVGRSGPLSGHGPGLYVASTLAVLIVLSTNLDRPGFRLILVGAVLNLIAIGANGGQMPGSAEAITALHGGLPTDTFTNSTAAGAGTPFAFLGDIFVLPRPFPFANVFSIGDVMIGAGGAWFVARTMRAGRPGTDLVAPRPAAGRRSLDAAQA